jgi:SAM-dependent methyltransferase
MIDEYYQIHIARYRQIIDAVLALHLPSPSKVLDVGCYPLHLFKLLEQQNYQVFGISSPHEPVNHPQVKTCDLENEVIPFKANQFDLVIFTEVFEHLCYSPSKVLIEINRVLKPGGWLIFTTPNVLRFQNIINLILGKNIYFPLFQLDQPLNFRHHREYTHNEVIQIMTESKFKIIKSDFIISYPPFRQRNQKDHFFLKIIKYFNYFFSLLFSHRRDTLFFLVQKPL